MTRTRLACWIAFLGGAGAIAIHPDLLPSPAPSAPAVPAPLPPPAHPVPLAALRAASAASAASTVVAAAAMPAASGSDLFAAKSWQRPPPPPPPPPAPTPPPPPPPPAAPPLPFRFIGRMDDGATAKVFLQRGEQVYAVAVGDVIERQYRVERIDAAQMTLVYLPLQQRQPLLFGKPS